MEDQSIQNEETGRRLLRLMFFRVAITTFLLGIAAFIQIKGTKSLTSASLTSVYFIIIVTYVLSFLYLFLLKKIKRFEVNVYIQAVCDVFLITVLVYATGGIRSFYSAFYPLIIIYSGLYLAKKGGLIIASACALLYGLLLDLEFYGVVHPIYSSPWEYNFSAGYVLSTIFVQLVSFYIVALLTSFIVEQEKRSRALLKEKESEFHQLDLLHKSIIESVNVGIVTIDNTMKIKSFNRAAEKMTGFSLFDVEGKGIDVLPGFSEMLDRSQRSPGQGEEIEKNEIVVLGNAGQKIILGFSISPLIGTKDNKIGDIIIFQDLTATKEMESEVEKNKRLALIGEMAAGLAHEIRNPLASLSGSIQMLKSNLHLDETDERLMQIILRGRNQLESLVKNFLLLARPDQTGYKEFSMNEVIENVLESLCYDPEWHEDIKVEKKLCDDSQIYGNRSEMHQMIWNLTLNAVQSMPGGGRLVIESFPVQSENKKEYLELLIRDTGCGIEKYNTAEIFMPFFTTKERGTGLGLAIAHRIIETHGGEIKIDSELNHGTACSLILPKMHKEGPMDNED